jgi:hypothetical protein
MQILLRLFKRKHNSAKSREITKFTLFAVVIISITKCITPGSQYRKEVAPEDYNVSA